MLREATQDQTSATSDDQDRCRRALLSGVAAYGLWGLIPLYFRALAPVTPLEILAHRVLWSFVLLAGVISVGKRWGGVGAALRSSRVMITLAASTTLIAVNWLTYIYAVSSDQILQASLGYFIAPLVNVLLGVVFLKERLQRFQLLGLLLATAGVINLGVLGRELPWIAVTLAVTFGLYGLLRKTVAADGLLGLFIETLLLLPLSVAALGYWHAQGTITEVGLPTVVLLVLSGLVTAVPLLLFAAAARGLQLSTLGFLQYLAPSIQFLLAVLAFGEPFSRPQMISFGCIWAAVAVYSAGSLRSSYRPTRAEAEPAASETIAGGDGLR